MERRHEKISVALSEKPIRGEPVESFKLRYFKLFEFFDHTGLFRISTNTTPTEICCGCKIPEFSRNLIFIIFVPDGIVVFTLTFNEDECLFPSLIRDETAGGSSYEICKFEMDSAIPTG